MTQKSEDFKKEFEEIYQYFETRMLQIEERWRIINQYGLKDENGIIDEESFRLLYEQENLETPLHYITSTDQFNHNMNSLIEKFKRHDINCEEDFEFYRPLQHQDYHPERSNPAPGLTLVNLRYHSDNPVVATPEIPSSGFPLKKELFELIKGYYPQYETYIDDYHRPLGTTDATFNDFNKEQAPCKPLTQERKDAILRITKRKLGIKPYQPLHYEATVFAKMPLNTGTGYFNRHNYRLRALARLTRPEPYKDKPTSKGYFFNATHLYEKIIIHNIKHFRSPRDEKRYRDHPIKRSRIVKTFIAKRTTMLYTRNHISLKPKEKCRPVYNVDPVFLKLEAMLTLPGMVQMRPTSSCILYSYETIRGGAHALDAIAQRYSSYFSIDWSSFDQKLPRVFTDLYYEDFLESLIVINKGYANSIAFNPKDYQSGDLLYSKMSNALQFLHEWYNSMAFTTADGYTYQRTHAGVPSGLLNTQQLDSVCNIFLISDALLEYGYTEAQIDKIELFVMGDDNTGFTHFSLPELEDFITFFEGYAKERQLMNMSKDKCTITDLRQHVEIIGYRLNFGYAKRAIGKLVAQLCYPERGLKEKYMSYRAIGIAYAAAGHDEQFHNFCRDVYFMYYKDRADLTAELKLKMRKHLPSMFRAVEDSYQHINLEHFPTIYEVQDAYKTWLGPLSYEPRWDTSYFTDLPYCTDEDIVTISDYRKSRNIPRPTPEYHDLNDM